jgi:peptide/nickel transport system substrate-binding protein
MPIGSGGLAWYTAVNPMWPHHNIHCKAVLYAADHEGYQRAYGGEAGGDIASNMPPPLIPGGEVRPYNIEAQKKGDLETAKQGQQCGQPNGFATNISYRSGGPGQATASRSRAWPGSASAQPCARPATTSASTPASRLRRPTSLGS